MRDTEAKATERYMRNGFGKLGSKSAYKRYAAYVELLKSKSHLTTKKGENNATTQ